MVVSFMSGQSWYSDSGVDYMVGEANGVELYAERDPMEYVSDEDRTAVYDMSDDDKLDFLHERYPDFDTLTYEDLKADILEQAKRFGISEDDIDFR